MPSCAPGWNNKLCREHLSVYQTWCDRFLKQSLEKPPTLAAWVSHWHLSKRRRDVKIFALSVEAAFGNKGWPHVAGSRCLSLLVRAVQAVFLPFFCWSQNGSLPRLGTPGPGEAEQGQRGRSAASLEALPALSYHPAPPDGCICTF